MRSMAAELKSEEAGCKVQGLFHQCVHEPKTFRWCTGNIANWSRHQGRSSAHLTLGIAPRQTVRAEHIQP